MHQAIYFTMNQAIAITAFAATAAAITAVLHARQTHLEKFIAKAKIYEPRSRTQTRPRLPSPPREDIPQMVIIHP
jgi:hypothetical protein